MFSLMRFSMCLSVTQCCRNSPLYRLLGKLGNTYADCWTKTSYCICRWFRTCDCMTIELFGWYKYTPNAGILVGKHICDQFSILHHFDSTISVHLCCSLYDREKPTWVSMVTHGCFKTIVSLYLVLINLPKAHCIVLVAEGSCVI